MILTFIDWLIIAIYLVISVLIGIWSSKKNSHNLKSYFLAGKNLPWWILGVSMVATTFSTDTPNLITGIVRRDGVSGNWVWWAFLLTGMVSVFIFAKLWNRSGLLTDIEFYELRYGGQYASFLRGFRAIYLGLVFNCLVMGAVSLAAVKFGEIVLGIEGWKTLLIAGSATIVYSVLGGLKAVIINDLIQFILAMLGSILATAYILSLPQINGLENLLNHPQIINKINIFPDFSDPNIWVPLFFVPLAVQWWSTYYPGSEPGGGGFIAQRMFSAKNEKDAIAATFLFNFTHYAIRPWPWILIALSSLVIFPDLNSIKETFPNLSLDKLGDDVAYPAMLTLLPPGLIGLVSASLIAAYMSTMSTLLNLGSSYLINDFYKRYIDKSANEQKLVLVGKIITVFLLLIGGFLGLTLTSANQAFNLLLLLGAGTGGIYILRWFWWRISAISEIIAMISSFIIAVFLNLDFFQFEEWIKISLGAFLTTLAWLFGTFLTKPEDDKVLINFVKKINPSGLGWKKFSSITKPKNSDFTNDFMNIFIGLVSVYLLLIGIGHLIYDSSLGYLFVFLSFLATYFIYFKIKND